MNWWVCKARVGKKVRSMITSNREKFKKTIEEK